MPTAQGDLGMGNNSTLLNALKAAGRIATRSYSYWYGFAGAPSVARKDGQFVLGGYDAGQIVASSNYTKKVTPVAYNCNMRVTISNLILNFPNGTNHDLLAGEPTFDACLNPSTPVLLKLLYNPYWTNFFAATNMDTSYENSHGGEDAIAFWDMIYPSASVSVSLLLSPHEIDVNGA